MEKKVLKKASLDISEDYSPSISPSRRKKYSLDSKFVKFVEVKKIFSSKQSELYQGKNLANQQDVAIKRLKCEKLYLKESQILKQIKGIPHVIQLIDNRCSEVGMEIITKYYQNGDLIQYIQ